MDFSFLTNEELLRHIAAQEELTPLEETLFNRLESAEDEYLSLNQEVKRLEEEMEALQGYLDDTAQEGNGIDTGG